MHPCKALRLCTNRIAHKGSGGMAPLFLDHGTRRGEGSESHSGRSLPPGKTRYPLYGGLGGPQGRSGQVRKISPPPGFDPRSVQPIASRYTDWATRPIKIANKTLVIYIHGETAPVSQGLLIIENSRSHSGTALSRTFLDEWSARHRNLYLTTHNTHNRQTSIPPAVFEPAIPANKRPQTHSLDRL